MPYDKDKLINILLQSDCRTLSEHGKVLAKSNKVFKLIASRMALSGSHINPNHIYTIVNENRNGFKTKIMEMYNIQKKEPDKNSTNDSSFSNFSTDDISFDESKPLKKLKIILSPQNWLDIAPKKTTSSGRLYWKFKEGWADIIAEKLCQQQKNLECVFAFRNNLTTPTVAAKNYSTFIGHCVECKAEINGVLNKRPMTDNDVIFVCTIDGIDSMRHTGNKTRQLRGKRREKVANKMINEHKSAVVIRRQMAKQLKTFGGKTPVIIPKAAVLRKAKEQQLLKAYELDFASGPINLLRESKYGKCAGFIQSIGLLKFFCMYWTPEQEHIYTARCKRDLGAIMTIDATGGIEKRSNKDDPYIFLYQCMIVTTEGSVPVFQMVSADQRSIFIAFFLRCILAKGAPRPPIVVCDFGRALINAIAEIFASCSNLSDYLGRCYFLIYGIATIKPTCYLRLDISHIAAMISRLKCINNQVTAAKKLYQRCVAQAHQMSDFKELSYFIESILVVSLSEYVGETKVGVPLSSEIRMRVLNNVIEGVDFNFVQKEEEIIESEKETNFDIPDDIFIASNWKIWSEELYNSAAAIASTCKTGKTINACYNPDFAVYLKKQLMPFLPLWTGIMRPHFGVGSIISTSSSVEAEFNDLKHRSFANELPMRIDLFVLKHLHHLDGKVKLASKPSDKQLTSANKIGETNDIISKSIDLQIYSSNDEEHALISIDAENSQLKVESEKIFNENIISSSRSTPEYEWWNCYEDWRGQGKNDSNLIIDSDEPSEQTFSLTKKCDKDEEIKDEYSEKSIEFTDKKRRKLTTLDKCPEWQHIKDVKISKIPNLRNGNICNTVNMGKYILNIRNTCAFDTILQVVLNGIASNRHYSDNLKESNNETVQLAKDLLQQRKRISSIIYKKRAILLTKLTLFEMKEFTIKIKRLDAKCNVSHLAQYLFEDIPSCVIRASCPCGYEYNSKQIILHINVDIVLNNGFGYMQRAIDEGQLTNRTCRNCSKIIKDEIKYGYHILIDTSILTDSRYTVGTENIRHTLDSITKILSIQDNKYSLAGIVHYLQDEEHYVGYAKSGNYWHEYDDLRSSRVTVTNNKEIKPHLIIYASTEINDVKFEEEN